VIGPIGYVMLSDREYCTADNPKGWHPRWFKGDIVRDLGAYGPNTILQNARGFGASCVVVWDGGGQAHPHPGEHPFGGVSYDGDPRQCDAAVWKPLAVDFVKAGMPMGFTLRPTLCVMGPNHPMQVAGDPYTILADKIQWAKWVYGASFWYVDSNYRPGPWPPKGNKPRLCTANTFTRLRADFPTDTFIPELYDGTHVKVPGVLPYVEWDVRDVKPGPARCALVLKKYDRNDPAQVQKLAVAFEEGAVPFVDCGSNDPEYNAEVKHVARLYAEHRP
jgi:hypothetical protein